MDMKTHRREEHGLSGLNENLRQIVYGGNDGIVTTFAVVAGFAGFAGTGAHGTAELGAVAVILFGLANLFADATSMGLGEFLSSRSERDVYRATRAGEDRLIADDPRAERQEVLEILAERGLSPSEAADFAAQLERHPRLMADFMMRYEFGMADPDDQSPAVNGLYTFVSFLVFGILPLVPYFLLPPTPTTFLVSSAATAGALFLLGVLRYVATRENFLRCVGETLLIGGTCAVVAFGVGVLVAA